MVEKIKGFIKKHPIASFFIAIVILVITVNLFSKNSESPVTDEDRQNAIIELKDLMKLTSKAGLVSSYNLSDPDTEYIVYVGPVWYTQDVTFKKDFLAKLGLLKKKITEYTHFVIKDRYSGEKVAEITAFGQDLKVYK